MNSTTIQTLAEFTSLIEETFIDQAIVLFRGQPRDLPLLPAIARERLTDEVLAIEKTMLEEFQRYSLPYIQIKPTTTWEWLALAQHHGLPTRLLDWSQNPLTSLWFSVHRSAYEEENGVLWIFRPEDEDFASDLDKNTLTCKRNMVFAPKHLTERITAQAAWFTIHKSRPIHPEFEPLEQSIEFSNKLTKVIIPPDRFAHLRFHLDRYGVNYSSVFPGLDGLCAYIKWKRCFLADEARTLP